MKLLIFTYAPAGLGHLRVTDAIADNMPKNSNYYILGSIDKFITWAHRFTSLNPFGKFLFLKSQYGVFEDITTSIYKSFLLTTSNSLYKQIKDIVDKHSEVDEIWVIATHFGMAHQIGAVKNRLISETGKDIKLIVQVTDDTSQKIWCVEGADMTFVPSRHTQEQFIKYTSEKQLKFVSEVIPYPLSSILSSRLLKNKGKRSDVFEKSGRIRVAVPISGAMVGLTYITELINIISKSSDRFDFWVLVRKSPLTKIFVSLLSKIPGVIVIVGKNDAEMVSLYELMYQQNIIHLEITKPSEQAFKAILSPRRVGGSILLFTEPVGRQEYENLDFLRRHRLVAGVGDKIDREKFGPSAPRAIKLPKDSEEAAKYILHAAESGIFKNMTKSFHFSKTSLRSGEVGFRGSKLFWKILRKKFG